MLRWVSLFNNADAGGLADLYHEDATNHQVPNFPISGKNAIHNMFRKEFAETSMTCIIENLFEDKDWAILEWKDPNGLRGCGFFQIKENRIIFQRGYWDKLSFLRKHNLPLPK